MALRSERRFIRASDLQTGMMIEFLYTKLDGDTKKYTAIVIDPNRINEHSQNSQLHALLIEDLSDENLIGMLSVIGQVIDINPDNRKQPITILNTDQAYSNYVSIYKNSRLYRTFLTRNISHLRQILAGQPE